MITRSTVDEVRVGDLHVDGVCINLVVRKFETNETYNIRGKVTVRRYVHLNVLHMSGYYTEYIYKPSVRLNRMFEFIAS